MANGNVRVRERFEVALDGGQIASIVVGALVTVGAVFVLGLKMGQHLATRQTLAARPADLTELDRPVVTGSVAPTAPALQYADKLPKQKPAPPPPIEPAKPAAASATPAPPPPQPVVAAAVAAPAAEHAAPPASEVVLPAPTTPSPTAAGSSAAGGKGFTVQLTSATSREDANRVVVRVKSHGPRVVEADVPGKGHFFRVRVGRFDSKESAERFRDDLARETGMKGVVMPE